MTNQMNTNDCKQYDAKYRELLAQDPKQKKYLIWLRVEAWYYSQKNKRKYKKYDYFRSAYSKRRRRSLDCV